MYENRIFVNNLGVTRDSPYHFGSDYFVQSHTVTLSQTNGKDRNFEMDRGDFFGRKRKSRNHNFDIGKIS